MEPQVYEWTCSICSYTWTIQSTQYDTNLTRYEAAEHLQYPTGVNPTYGLVSVQYIINAYSQYGITAVQKWVSFDEAYSICHQHTGIINLLGMYHLMAIRGVQSNTIWVANSAPGYCGVYDNLSRSQFNSLGPVQIVYLK